ncbi:DUF2141 domain-containing protein [Aequorivita sp. Q41]|uniref:DUF2141 domain-containing protein n=1 Tax=Aequorivita sp. Q41 TaxID=3153300 RepID=UPI003242B7D5
MKTIIISIGLSFFSILLNAQSDSSTAETGTTITVSVPCKSDEGNVLIGLYNENTFLKAAPIMSSSAEIIDGKATATFKNVTPGSYGISLFQDKNNNKRMDFDTNGMPTEPYGVSNNNMSYGPPMWQDAKFEVSNQPVEMEIRM